MQYVHINFERDRKISFPVDNYFSWEKVKQDKTEISILHFVIAENGKQNMRNLIELSIIIS